MSAELSCKPTTQLCIWSCSPAYILNTSLSIDQRYCWMKLWSLLQPILLLTSTHLMVLYGNTHTRNKKIAKTYGDKFFCKQASIPVRALQLDKKRQMATWQGQLVLRVSLFVCLSACQSWEALLSLKLSKLSLMCSEQPDLQGRGGVVPRQDEARAPSSVVLVATRSSGLKEVHKNYNYSRFFQCAFRILLKCADSAVIITI